MTFWQARAEIRKTGVRIADSEGPHTGHPQSRASLPSVFNIGGPFFIKTL
jgi:hypothetical protein